MADGINRVFLAGNLAQDPEFRQTQGGAVLNLRLACTESRVKGGERKEFTEYVTCVLWGGRAEALSRILRKGMGVTVLGSLTTRSWEDSGGQKRYATEVRVADIVLPSRSRENNDNNSANPGRRKPGGQGGAQQSSPADAFDQGGGYGGDDDDAPF
jgi:single-strand DNA-binding protein